MTIYTIPSNDNVALAGNPAGDMNNVANLLALITGGTPGGVLAAAQQAALSGTIVLGPSGDATGATDTAYINAAIAQIGSSGGRILLAAGTFYWICGSVVVSNAGVYIVGAGRWATIVSAVGTGDTIRMYSTASYSPGTTEGGALLGLTFDGTNAGAGSSGFHVGDIYNLEFNVGVRKFQGSGSKGAWLDNQYHWTEQMSGTIWAESNTANVVFDNSANTGGSATNSFARARLDIMLDCKSAGSGVVLQNGAEIYDSKLGIYGNMDYGTSQFYALDLTGQAGYSFTATNASPCVFTASGSYFSNGTYVILSGGSLPAGFTAGGYYVVSASGASFELSATSGGSAINSTSTGSGTVQGPYSKIFASQLSIGMECNAQSGTQPITIGFGSQGNNQIRDCYGVVDFTGNNAFASAANSLGSFQFDGPVLGDPILFRVTGSGQGAYANGTITNGSTIATRYNGMGTAAPAGNVTGIILQTNDPGTGGGSGGDWSNAYFTLVNKGAGSITFAASGTSNVATGAACVVPAGTSMTFAWLANSALWYPLQAPATVGTPAGGSPAGCIAQTMPWWYVSGSTIAAASGTLYLHAVTLPGGVQVSDLTFAIGSTSGATLTHGWYVLLNSSLLQVAHTADQTSGSLTGGTAVAKALVTPYTPAVTAPYYIGYMVVAGTQPAFCGSASVQGGSMFGEFPSNGPSSTGLTTPGTDGTTSYAAITAPGDPVYGYCS